MSLCNKVCNWCCYIRGAKRPALDAWIALDGPAILDGLGASRFWTLGVLWTGAGRQES